MHVPFSHFQPMKPPRLLIPLGIVVAAVLTWLLATRPPTSETERATPYATRQTAPAPSPAAAPTPVAQPPSMAAPAQITTAPAAAPTPVREGIEGEELADTPIRRLLRDSELLIEMPGEVGLQGQPGTVSIMRAPDSKYPLLRVEQPQNASETDEPNVMVADHFIVKKAESLTDDAFKAAVHKRGFDLRKKMLAPDTWLVAVDSSNPEQLVTLFPDAQRELTTIGRPEPDYLVQTFTNPDDPLEHLLWGLHNISGEVTVDSGAATGQTFAEGGKMSYAGEIPDLGLSGDLIDCGYGATAGDFPAAVNGQIALIQRGSSDGTPVTFATKVSNAKDAGAIGVLLYNNVPGGYNGTLSTFDDWLPVIPLTDTAGQALQAALPAAVTLRGVPNGRDISAREAWTDLTGSNSVLVGVIDTGVDYRHPDLIDNMWTNPGESGPDGNGGDKATNGIDDDGNGFIDDVHGWDFANDDNDPDDDNNHGTHCAGTIGATGNNTLGVAGVNWTVQLAAIKFLTKGGSGFISDGIDSIHYGTLIGADLTSNSWGGGPATSAGYDAIEDANQNGILFVAAAGNSATSAPSYPAGYDIDNVISVAATDSADNLASFSNMGLPHTDIAAPGVGILSTLPTFRTEEYGFLSGTSMACPHVAGAAAMLIAKSPSMPYLDVRQQILDTADPLPILTGIVVTGGRLNLAAALDGIYEEPTYQLVGTDISDDSGGNADGVPNPGETLNITITLANQGYLPGNSVTATLSSSDVYTTITDANSSLGTVPARGEATGDALTISLDPSTPSPHTVVCDLTIQDAGGSNVVLPLTIRISDTYHLTGTVTLDGSPLANATLTYGGAASGESTTAPDGTFDIPVPEGSFDLSASYQDDPLSETDSLSLTTPGDQTNLLFELTTATLAGEVLDDDTDSPVEGALVTFLGPVDLSLTTDSNGQFDLTRIYGRPVEWQVGASKLSDYDYPASAQAITVPPDRLDLEFRLGYPRFGFEAVGGGSADGHEVVLAPDSSTTRSITIRNDGVADLDWQLAPLANGGGTPGAEIDQFPVPNGLLDVSGAPPLDGSAYNGQDLYWFKSGVLFQQDTAGNFIRSRYIPEEVTGFPISKVRLACFDGEYFWFEQRVSSLENSDHDFLKLYAVDLVNNEIVETIDVDRRLYSSVSANEIVEWSLAQCHAVAEGVFFFFWATYDVTTGDRTTVLARINRQTGDLISTTPLPIEVNWPVANATFTDFDYFNGSIWMIQSERDYGLGGFYQDVYEIDPDTGSIIQSLTPPGSTSTTRYRELQADRNGTLWLFQTYPNPEVVQGIDSGVRLWMEAAPTIGSLASGQSQTIDVAFDSTGLEPGVHHGAFRVSTNDPARGDAYIPLLLNVAPGDPSNSPPLIGSATPSSPVVLDENTSQTFTIENFSDPDNASSITWQYADVQVNSNHQIDGTTPLLRASKGGSMEINLPVDITGLSIEIQPRYGGFAQARVTLGAQTFDSPVLSGHNDLQVFEVNQAAAVGTLLRIEYINYADTTWKDLRLDNVTLKTAGGQFVETFDSAIGTLTGSLTSGQFDSPTLVTSWSLNGRLLPPEAIIPTANGESYTFNADYFSQGGHALAVALADPNGDIDSQFWRILVNNVNRAPIAEDAAYTLANSDTLDFTLQASDPDGDYLLWEIVTPPANGTIEGTAPDLTYIPQSGFVGQETLTFQVTDGDLTSNLATITFDVGFRDISAPLTPLTVTVPHGNTATRDVIISNTGTTPLRWTAAMTSDLPVADAGLVLGTTPILGSTSDLPTTALDAPNHAFVTYMRGLAWNGTHFLRGVTEIDENKAFFRAHLLRFDPFTGALVEPTIPNHEGIIFNPRPFETMAWDPTNLSVWALTEDFVRDSGSHIMEYGITEPMLEIRHDLFQYKRDFGSYNRGVTANTHGIWLYNTATSGDSTSGVYRIPRGSKQILDRFDSPYGAFSGGPITYGNGVLWFINRFGGPFLKMNPFDGSILEENVLPTTYQSSDMAYASHGGIFVIGNDEILRLHNGDYLRMTPDNGTIEPGETATLTVTFDSLLAGGGTHTGFVHLLSDDPDEPDLAIPFTFEVGPEAGNNLPSIDSFAPAGSPSLITRQLQSFSVAISDPDSDPLSIRWILDGERIYAADDRTTFDYLAGLEDVGAHTLTVLVDDLRGGIVEQTWNFTVTNTGLTVDAVASPARGLAPLQTTLGAVIAGGTTEDGAFDGREFVVVEGENYHRSTDFEDGIDRLSWFAYPGYPGSIGEGALYLDARFISPPFDPATTTIAEYDIQFAQAGTYHLWMRVFNQGDTRNSAYVGMDGALVGGVFDDTDAAEDFQWDWVKHDTPFSVEAGTHVFEIRGREPDYVIDRILFTTDSDFIPAGTGPTYQNAQLPAVTYSWDFGDSSPGSNEALPGHLYEVIGEYLATVQVSDGTEVASDSVTIIAQGSYNDWANQHLGSLPVDLRDPGDIPPGSRLPNLIRYALGITDLQDDGSDAIRMEMQESGDDTHLTMIYQRSTSAGDIEIHIEVGSALNDWASNADGTTVTTIESVNDNQDGTETVVERDMERVADHPRRFIRMRVELLAP